MTHALTRRRLMALTSGALALAASGLHAQTATAPVADYGIGDPQAKVKVVEYLSFTCPHCARFHSEVLPRLKADYIDTGQVRLEYREVYFDQLGLLAAMLARCGGEMRYLPITDMLFDKQTDWAGAADLPSAVAALKKIGLVAGMEDAALDACLRDQTMAEALVAHYQANIAADFPNDSFGGTPSFIINGATYSNMGYAEMQAVVDVELAK